jgi:hypothetical protein
MVSIFMLDPWEIHWKETKIILRDLHGTVGYGLVYKSIEDFRVTIYIDLDWESCMDDNKSTSNYTFNMGSSTID